MDRELDLNEAMAHYAAGAVEYALKVWGIDLDYSPGSIAGVEVIAGKLYQETPKTFFEKFYKRAPDQKTYEGLCSMLGSYVGEVYRRLKGGEWGYNEQVAPGKRILGIRNGDEWIFPVSKVAKRLTKGEEDNLVAFFERVTKSGNE